LTGGYLTCRNVAAAERTLQKQLTAVKDSEEEVRPEFVQRLAGTLADVIARAAQQEAASAKHTHSQLDRMPEIIGLLQTAFEVNFSNCHRHLHLPRYTWQQCRSPLVAPHHQWIQGIALYCIPYLAVPADLDDHDLCSSILDA
jgi:hypothetical protein